MMMIMLDIMVMMMLMVMMMDLSNYCNELDLVMMMTVITKVLSSIVLNSTLWRC